MSEQSIIGVYKTMSGAEEAIHKLDRDGFPLKQVSIVSQNLQSEKELHGYVIAGDITKGGAGFRTRTWGLFEQVPGAAFIWVPDFGPLVIAGLLAEGLLRGVEAGVEISSVDGVLHALAGWGVPLKQIVKYEEVLKAGRYLVVAHGDGAEGAKARGILQDTTTDDLQLYYRTIGLARFVAMDPFNPAASEKELNDLLGRMDGVIDWISHDNGDVTLEYDRNRISDDLIEDALVGIGFKLKHIFDRPDVSETEAHEALDH